LHIKENQVAYKEHRFSLYECLDCQLWFSPGKDGAFISNDDYMEVFSRVGREVAVQNRYDVIKGANLSRFGSVLEIGCALGDILAKIRTDYADIRVSGLEASSKMAAYVRERGIPCTTDPKELDHSVDFVFANHVFEHFQNPGDFFSILEVVGRQEVEVRLTFPNRDNYWIKRGLFPDLHLPHHRFYYTVDQVCQLFSQAGYEILEARTLENQRLKTNLHQSLYNRYREDLDSFKSCFSSIEDEFKRIFDVDVRELEEKIEFLGLGSEGLIHARKLNP